MTVERTFASEVTLMNRIPLAGPWALVALIGAGCGSTVIDRHEDDPTSASVGEGGGASQSVASVTASSGRGGGAPGAAVDDTGTLAVEIRVSTYGALGVTAREAQVGLNVIVMDAVTGLPVTDAVVTGGRVGHSAVLDADLYAQGVYDGGVTGYDRTWEFSIVRGSDHLTGVVLVGPSFQTVLASQANGSATIAWSPAEEPGVRAEACADSVPPAEPAVQCRDGGDDGSVVLAPVDAGAAISVDRQTEFPIGISSSAVVEVAVACELP